MKALKEGSQSARILGFLAHGHTLTPISALSRFGCFRLGARIFALKERGHKIKSEIVSLKNGKRVASYRLAARQKRA